MTDTVTEIPRMYGVRDLARITGYSVGTIYNMIYNGTAPRTVRAPGKNSRVMFMHEDVIAWMDSLRVTDPVKTRNYRSVRSNELAS